MKRVLGFVIAPLLVGAIAYFALRGPEIRLFGWASAIGLAQAIAWIRMIAAPVRPHVPTFIAGSLPDAAWAFAFGAALALVWKKPGVWMWIGLGVTASLELAQAVHLIPGVFDWIDLVAMLAAYLIAWRGILRAAAGGPTYRPSEARGENLSGGNCLAAASSRPSTSSDEMTSGKRSCSPPGNFTT
jgi:hypothetical protein